MTNDDCKTTKQNNKQKKVYNQKRLILIYKRKNQP